MPITKKYAACLRYVAFTGTLLNICRDEHFLLIENLPANIEHKLQFERDFACATIDGLLFRLAELVSQVAAGAVSFSATGDIVKMDVSDNYALTLSAPLSAVLGFGDSELHVHGKHTAIQQLQRFPVISIVTIIRLCFAALRLLRRRSALAPRLLCCAF